MASNFTKRRRDIKHQLTDKAMHLFKEGVQFNPQEMYERHSGRTTAIVLKYISMAYSEPNTNIFLDDHQFQNRDHIILQVKVRLQQLQLEDFKVDVSRRTLSYHPVKWKDL